MGLLSKLLGKKEKQNEPGKTEVQSKVNEEGEIEVHLKKWSESKPLITASIEMPRFEPEIPDYQGNYAQAVFLNAFQKAAPIKQNSEYQAYLLYECGIRNPAEYHQKMIAEGYLQEASFKDRLYALKVADLKGILKQAGYPVTGKKEILIQRILEVGEESMLDAVSTDALFALSEKGQQFLSQYDDYVKLHKHKVWGIDWQEYDSRKEPGYSFYDVCWGIFNERLLQSANFGRTEYFLMFELLKEQGNEKLAFEFLLRVFYLDVSGIEGISLIELYAKGAWSRKEAKDFFGSSIMLAPGIIDAISRAKEYYSDDLVDELYETQLPVQVCDKQMFLDLIHSIIDGTYDEEKATKKLKKAFEEFVENCAH